MKQLASTSVRCEVTDENREILIRALCKELGLDDDDIEQTGHINDSYWFEFYRSYYFDSIYVKIFTEALPDKRGFYFSAQGEPGGLIHNLLSCSGCVFQLVCGIAFFVLSLLFSLFTLDDLGVSQSLGSILLILIPVLIPVLLLYLTIFEGVPYILNRFRCMLFKRGLQRVFDHFSMLYNSGRYPF